MRPVEQIKREIAQAEALVSDPDLKGSKIFTADHQRKLYQARADALRVELASAEKERQTILQMASRSPRA